MPVPEMSPKKTFVTFYPSIDPFFYTGLNQSRVAEVLKHVPAANGQEADYTLDRSPVTLYDKRIFIKRLQTVEQLKILYPTNKETYFTFNTAASSLLSSQIPSEC